jgi:hypothetical protein
MLNRETRRAPAPPDTSSQTAWEDADHNMSEVACNTTTDNPGPDQYSPMDRLTPTQGKKKKNRIKNNEDKRDT